MSLTNEYTDNIFMDESSILDAHLRLLFRAYHYETPCRVQFVDQPKLCWTYEMKILSTLTKLTYSRRKLRTDLYYRASKIRAVVHNFSLTNFLSILAADVSWASLKIS